MPSTTQLYQHFQKLSNLWKINYPKNPVFARLLFKTDKLRSIYYPRSCRSKTKNVRSVVEHLRGKKKEKRKKGKFVISSFRKIDTLILSHVHYRETK